MPQRPLAIVLIALCYIFSPLSIIVFSSVFTNTPVIGPYTIFSKFAFSDWLVLCMYVISAVSVFLVRAWGWYVFMLASASLVGYNVVVFFLRPQYSLLLPLIFNVTLVFVAGIFFRRAVIAPFFNPCIRWWEQATRYEIGIRAMLEVDGGIQTVPIVDISESGIFIMDTAALRMGAEYPITMVCMRHTVSVTARVMRQSERDGLSGYGLMFMRMSSGQRQGIRKMLHDLKKAETLNKERRHVKRGRQSPDMPRYLLNTMVMRNDSSGKAPAVLLDLSRKGCLMEGSLALNETVSLRIICLNREIEVIGRGRWMGNVNGVVSCGVLFDYENRLQRRHVACIVRLVKKAGAPDRLESAKPLPDEIILRHALNSPYRIVHALSLKLQKGKP